MTDTSNDVKPIIAHLKRILDEDCHPRTWAMFRTQQPALAIRYWGDVRCSRCWGIGTIERFTVLTDIGGGAYNGEPVGDRLCPDCGGSGLAI